jgi:hypothetical protein
MTQHSGLPNTHEAIIGKYLDEGQVAPRRADHMGRNFANSHLFAFQVSAMLPQGTSVNKSLRRGLTSGAVTNSGPTWSNRAFAH